MELYFALAALNRQIYDCKLHKLIKVGRQIPPPVFTGGIYRYLPVWKILLNWQILANTGKLNFFALKLSRNLKADGLKQYNQAKWVKNI